MRPVKHAARSLSLGVVLACVAGTMAIGVVTKSPCASGEWTDAKQYRLLCYTDIVPLLGTEQLAGGRWPFLDPCEETDASCDEYPVLTMYVMRLATLIGGTGYTGFYYTNALLLGLAAATIATCLWLLVGRRALWFALAPTLLIYGTVNWDLVAVAFATAALLAFASRRDGWAGGMLGAGAATKLYPLLLFLPLFLQGLRDREPDRSVRLLWWTAGTTIAINLPFALVARAGWFEFFRFNAVRLPDFDSVWHISCRHIENACTSTGRVNLLSGVAFAAVFGAAWWLKARRQPGFPPWTLGLPLLIAFLLTNKVYSPQYGLWLLPWFALVGPDLRRFVAFQVADVAVFVTRFWFFGALTGGYAPPLPGFVSPQAWFELAVALRAAVLVWVVVGWIRTESAPLVLGSRGWRTAQASQPVATPA